ncbi:MAG: ubiquinone/menaquinone biosynthesis methyltransferase [Gemmatimonadaceae bacterium]
MASNDAPSEGAAVFSDERRVAVTRANLRSHVADPAVKQRFVSPLFDLIAPRYDSFTRAFSFGMDAQWKRQLVEWVAHAARAQRVARMDVLDLACGTGDLALAVAAAVPGARVCGIDLSEPMLGIARERLKSDLARRVRFERDDLASLARQGDASMDVITAGYAFRNAPDLHQALGAARRVLRVGGMLYTLDFFRPEGRAWRTMYLAYLRAAGAAVGWWWHRAPAAYEYIAASIAHYVSSDGFSAVLDARGFEVSRVARRLWGGVALIAARRR